MSKLDGALTRFQVLNINVACASHVRYHLLNITLPHERHFQNRAERILVLDSDLALNQRT